MFCSYLIAFFLLTHPGLIRSADDQIRSIFILAGQSNMAGRGGVMGDRWDGVIPPECQPNPSVLRFSARLRWEEAREPLHADIDLGRTCGVGPGLAFANAVRDLDSSAGVVGLVPCAVGGTNIREWARGGRLYNETVKRAEVAVREGGAIRAIVWYQGESDTVSLTDAESYKGNLEKLFKDFRADLQSPTLPIIQVAIASGLGPLVGVVRTAQMEVEVPNVWTVDAMGLPLEADGLHLSTLAQVRLGKMLAQSFIKTLPSKSPVPVAIFSNAASNNEPSYFTFLLGHFLFCTFVGTWRTIIL